MYFEICSRSFTWFRFDKNNEKNVERIFLEIELPVKLQTFKREGRKVIFYYRINYDRKPACRQAGAFQSAKAKSFFRIGNDLKNL